MDTRRSHLIACWTFLRSCAPRVKTKTVWQRDALPPSEGGAPRTTGRRAVGHKPGRAGHGQPSTGPFKTPPPEHWLIPPANPMSHCPPPPPNVLAVHFLLQCAFCQTLVLTPKESPICSVDLPLNLGSDVHLPLKSQEKTLTE